MAKRRLTPKEYIELSSRLRRNRLDIFKTGGKGKSDTERTLENSIEKDFENMNPQEFLAKWNNGELKQYVDSVVNEAIRKSDKWLSDIDIQDLQIYARDLLQYMADDKGVYVDYNKLKGYRTSPIKKYKDAYKRMI